MIHYPVTFVQILFIHFAVQMDKSGIWNQHTRSLMAHFFLVFINHSRNEEYKIGESDFKILLRVNHSSNLRIADSLFIFKDRSELIQMNMLC